MAEFDKGTVSKNIFSPDNPGQTKDSHAIFIAVLEILASATEQEKEMNGHLDWKNINKDIYVLGQQDSEAGNQAC